MPSLATRRSNPLLKLATLAFALTILSLSASDASAQFAEKLRAHNRHFYGDLYEERGYADSLGLHGHKRCVNGGFYGPPQIYSRQYGTIYGYRTDLPFQPLRANQGVGYSGSEN
jgi:hypothetical protein